MERKEIEYINNLFGELLQEKRYLEEQKRLYEKYLKEVAYLPDKKYYRYEIGKMQLKIEKINYIYAILEKRFAIVYKKYENRMSKIDSNLQQKIM